MSGPRTEARQIACRSSELRSGELRTIRLGDREGVLWRGASGQVSAVDAYCPHLGAHIGEGGRVDGEDLVCPFHGWRFDAGGRCTGIGYATGSPPAKAAAVIWEVEEEGGEIVARAPEGPPLPRRGLDQVPSLPGSFAEGWYKVALSGELDRAGVLRPRYFGRDVQVRREHSGTPVAYIDGKTLACAESGGIVMAWYGPGEPTFDAPDFGAYDDPSRSRRRYVELVGSSVWDVAENPFDFAHFRTIHDLDFCESPEIEEAGATIHLRFLGRSGPPVGPRVLRRMVPVSTHVRSFGLGLTDTHIRFHRFFGPVWMIGCNTPVEDRRTEYTLIFVSGPGVEPRPLRRALHQINAARIWKVTEMERVVWRKKRYLKNPHLTVDERGLAHFRRWARQFRCA